MSRPLHLSVEVTNLCNLNCKFCFKRGLVDDYVKKNMSLKEFKYVVNKVKPMVCVTMVGLGEPFINPDFLGMLRFLKKKGLGANFSSNGMLLNKEVIDELHDLGVRSINLSIDGACKQTFEERRIGAVWETFLENTKYLLSKGIKVNFSMVGDKGNIHELPALVGLAKDLGVSSINVLNVHCLRKEWWENHLHNMDVEELHSIYRECSKIMQGSNMRLDLARPMPVPMACWSPFVDPHIRVDGDVFPCCFIGSLRGKFVDYYGNVGVNVDVEDFCFGNIFRDRFSKIWDCERLNRLRYCVFNYNNLQINKSWNRQEYYDLRKGGNYNFCCICSARFKNAC